MANISRLHETDIANGNTVDATHLDAEFDQLVNEHNSKETRLDDLETNAMTINGVKTFGSIPVLPGSNPTAANEAVRKTYCDLKLLLTGGTLTGALTLSGAPTTGLHAATKTYVDGQVNSPRNYLSGAPPVYATAATFTVASFSVKNVDNDAIIEKTTSTTVDISTTGLNGVGQSSNLSGTVSSSGTTVTGTSTTFLTDFQVGDVFTASGESIRIDTITNDTTLDLVSAPAGAFSGDTYQRGGEAADTWYYLYAIDDSSTPGLMLSTRNVAGGDTLVDLPSGYTDSRQLHFALRNDSSSDIIPFFVRGWPYQPSIEYQVFMHIAFQDGATVGTTNVLSGGTSASFADVDLSSFVPPISQSCSLHMSAGGSGGYIGRIRKDGETHNGKGFYVSTSTSLVEPGFPVETSSSQKIEYIRVSGGADLDINIQSFDITEVV